MNSAISPAVRTGVASRISTAVTSTVHTKIGIRNRVMPGARILKIGGDEVDRAQDRGGADQRQADDPQVGADALGERLRERRVAGPALGGGAAEQVAAEDEDAAQRQQPEAQGVDAREGHVRRAELERHDVVREAASGPG